jgi:hypothetical protein
MGPEQLDRKAYGSVVQPAVSQHRCPDRRHSQGDGGSGLAERRPLDIFKVIRDGLSVSAAALAGLRGRFKIISVV